MSRNRERDIDSTNIDIRELCAVKLGKPVMCKYSYACLYMCTYFNIIS